MSSSIGEKLKVNLFGQSHSAGIGMTMEGFPAGFSIDTEALQRFLERRAPGRNSWSTARAEADVPEFLCGLAGNITCGAPLTAIIRNTDAKSGDYESLRRTPRPGHADYTAEIRYGGYQDAAGGGHLSGRLTAPLCIAGGICLQYLAGQGIKVQAHIAEIGGISDEGDPLLSTAEKAFPTLSDSQGEKMRELIERMRAEGDSVGGIIECTATGVPAGLGDPLFGGMENRLAAVLFGIPAMKGVEFGAGFGAARMTGSENNDGFRIRNGKIETESNHAGGILGGITTGMPLVLRAAFKPTPSIAKKQRSVNLETGEEAEIHVSGRHDPCIVPRAVPAVEAATAIVLTDALLSNGK